jgi:hypothetical protein
MESVMLDIIVVLMIGIIVVTAYLVGYMTGERAERRRIYDARYSTEREERARADYDAFEKELQKLIERITR